MADHKSEPKKKMSAFAMFQAKNPEAQPKTEASFNTSKTGKGKKGKNADKRKLPETPNTNIPQKMAKRLRMSLRKGDKNAQKTPARSQVPEDKSALKTPASAQILGNKSAQKTRTRVQVPLEKSAKKTKATGQVLGNKSGKKKQVQVLVHAQEETDIASSSVGSAVNGVGEKHEATTNNEDSNPAIYVQQKPSTSGVSSSSSQSNQAEDEHPTVKNLEELFNSTPHTDSADEAQKYFEWLIHPIKPDNFFSHLFERKPLLLRRHDKSYNEGLFSSEEMDSILKKNDIQFSRNLDITSYTDGKRETHNPVGRALAPVVWDYYQNGCSIRMLNPQTYSHSVWKLNSTLQEYFSCLVGANVYLTPAGTQGFAPHYDDIEAFVIQLEGKKHWRLYKPRNDKETLPRFSSGNFDQKEIGKPILDTILEPGDLLYFPRGTIHQANALEDTHSLHITLSACQKTTWGDLLEKLVPQALKVAIEEDVEFRHALPRDYLNYMGVALADTGDNRRLKFLKKVGQLMTKLAFYAPVDAAADKMGTEYMHDALPPVLSTEEESCSIFSSPACCKNGVVINSTELEGETEIRLIRRGIVRLTSDGNQVHIYHSLENDRQYHKKEPQFLEVPVEAGPAIEHLIRSYPDYITIDSLQLSGQFKEQQLELAEKLYESGVIVTRTPVQPIDEESSI